MNAVEQAVSALDSGRRPAGPRAAGERQPARTGECSRLAMRLPCAFLATGLAQDASKFHSSRSHSRSLAVRSASRRNLSAALRWLACTLDLSLEKNPILLPKRLVWERVSRC